MAQEKDLTPWYHNPLGLGLLALALMVGGWKLSTYVALTPRQADQAGRLAEIRSLARDELRDRLDEVARHVEPSPPFRWAGRLLFLTGAALFVLAGILMFRKPAAQTDPATHDADPVDPDADLRDQEAIDRTSRPF
jgi:hypothetical protein